MLERLGVGVGGDERQAAGQHLEQDDAQGVDVAAAVQRLGAHLLRTHVAGRAQRRAGLRYGRARFIQQLDDAEVGQVGAAGGVEEDVGRLHVAVDDALAVGAVERAGNAGQQGHFARRTRPALQPVGQRAAGQVGHDQIGLAEVFPVAQNGHNGRVAQPLQHVGLALKALAEAGVAAQLDRHQLDGHNLPAARLYSAIDDGHAAVANLFDFVEAPDLCRRHTQLP